MKKKKSRVFVGPGNIAGNAMYIALALRSNGIFANSYSFKPHPFGYHCDYENILFSNPLKETLKKTTYKKIVINKHSLKLIKSIQKFFFFLNTLIKYDTYIFISHISFFDNNIDLRILSLLKKKIAVLFVGCPERDPMEKINTTDGGYCSRCIDIDKQRYLNCFNQKKRKKIQYISKHSNFIFSHRDTTTFLNKKSIVKSFFCISDFSVSRDEIFDKFKNNNKLIISHFPSNILFKGTSYVNNTITELEKNGIIFNYISERKPHSEIRSLLKKTHVLIDQFTYGNGLLAVEGMASGCVVICRTAKWFREDFPDLALVSCEPEELTNVLMELINDRERMLELALKSYEYFQKFHTPEVVGKYYKEILNLK